VPVPEAGELQANVSLANVDKSVANGSKLSRTTDESVDEVESDQKRSQQAFGGVCGRCSCFDRKAVASEMG
jgi:hypothetical protein